MSVYISLAEVAKFIVDNRGKTVPTSNEGIPLIKTNCITNDDLYPQIDGMHFISQETYDTWFRSHPEPDDIIITLKGSQNGAVCLVPDPVQFAIAQDMVAIRVDEKKINKYYLLAALRSREVQHAIKTLDVSGVIPHLKKSDFDKLLIKNIDRRKQDYIGGLYIQLSQKISLLRQQNETLEELAQTLFKRWFVDFEFPNENGEPYKSSGGKMVDSELGEIPEGWRVGEYKDIVDITSGKGLKKSEFKDNGKYEVLGANGRLGFTDNFLISENVIITGRVGTLGTVYIVEKPVWLSDNVLVSKPKKDLFHFSFFTLKRFDFKSLNSGSTEPLLTQADLKTVRIVIPDGNNLKKYSESVESTFVKIESNFNEIQSLTQLRDTLLPKLMSGEIVIKE